MRYLVLNVLLWTVLSTNGQQTIPAADVKSLDGQTIPVRDILENRLTLLSFWATWCGPCKAELDALKDVYPAWQEKYDFQLVAITIDNPRQLAKVSPMIKAKGWPYRFFEDTAGQLRTRLNFQVIPQSYLVNPAGHVVWSSMGFSPGLKDEMEEQLRKASGR